MIINVDGTAAEKVPPVNMQLIENNGLENPLQKSDFFCC
jgi:hypothetical protein